MTTKREPLYDDFILDVEDYGRYSDEELEKDEGRKDISENDMDELDFN